MRNGFAVRVKSARRSRGSPVGVVCSIGVWCRLRSSHGQTRSDPANFLKSLVFSKFLSPDGHAGRQVSEIPNVFQALRYAGRLLIDSIASCLATIQDRNRA